MDIHGFDVKEIERLDKFLSEQLKKHSRSQIKKFVNEGRTHVDGTKITDCAYRVKQGQKITIHIPSPKKLEIQPVKIPFGIAYEDENLLVIDKPHGLTVHPGAGNIDNTLVNALRERYGLSLSDIGGSNRPGIVHRLDKDTSGLMVVAKDNFTHMKLAEQLAERELKRKYLALVYGIFTPQMGRIETNIGRSRQNRLKMTVLEIGGKKAITHYKTIKTYRNKLSLLECQLETGRTHQIRVHMNFKKHGIVGDQTYSSHYNANLDMFNPEAARLIKNLKRQALHSYKLSFMHPIKENVMHFESNLPDDISEIISAI